MLSTQIRQSPKRSAYDDKTKFLLPKNYIRGIPSADSLKANAIVEFHSKVDCNDPRWSKVDSEDTIHIGGGSKMWLSGYARFKYPPRGDGSGVAPDRPTALEKLSAISWVMDNSDFGSSEPGTNFRSVHFRGFAADLSIPPHAVGFFTVLLQDVRKTWGQLLSDSESHLDQRVCQPFHSTP